MARKILKVGALARLREPGIEPDQRLVDDLEAYCAALDRRAGNVRQPNAGPPDSQ